MTSTTKVSPRRINTGLSSLLSINTPSSNQNLKVNIDSRHTCYAVLRSKGGSGEVHTTKKLVDELISGGKNVLVCYEHHIEDDHLITQYFSSPCNKVISMGQVAKNKSGILNCNWTNISSLSELSTALNNSESDYSIVFTCGTSSAGRLQARINSISAFCKKIFISVNSDVENSIEPCRRLLLNYELDLNKINLSWWYWHDFSTHLLANISIFELNKLSVNELNLIAKNTKKTTFL
jgi:hypothetical protein